jgi:hypothetical protein
MDIPIRFAVRRSATLLALAALLWSLPVLSAQDLKPIQLPKPQITAGMPLMQALAQRRTTRLRGQAAAPANPLEPIVGGLWRQPSARCEAGTGPHRALGHEQAGG